MTTTKQLATTPMPRLTASLLAPLALLLGVWAGGAGAGFEGHLNTFYGTNVGAGTTGDDDGDTFVGALAGYSNTTGDYNTFLGFVAGHSNTTGHDNTFVGSQAGSFNTTGMFNTFLGKYAGYINSIGYDNTFLGFSAGFNNTGSVNTFLGNFAGYSNTTGNVNTFLGNYAGYSNTTGYYNTYLGFTAGYANTTGNSNTALGDFAGYSNTTGNNNVLLGYGAGYSETGSNKLYIANSFTSTPLLYGQFDTKKLTVNGNLGVGVSSPTFPLQMASGARVTAGGVWTNASSRSYKEAIIDLPADQALAAVKALTPVTFQYRTEQERHVGFIAEDVPDLLATPDRKGVSPMDVVAVLTRAVQEQQKTIEQQQLALEALQKLVEEQQGREGVVRTVSLTGGLK